MIDYTQIAMCVIGMSLYFNAGKIEARTGATDHSVLWAVLSLLASLVALWASAGWVSWALAQAGLFVGITLTRVAFDGRS
jgi:hypothetical protein